ncbi:hypothetical protein [Paenibacillus naphthalenovorans]|uniref:Uncharacterized protein n=1 Tax=Paenibacillus naphthalenovorans TaxID=162209 RepID=A0A0U2UJW2_9BACL|nr:hypothetical protein [Paenibacillus naphthalenovorans]ALS22225.1 hypothetical protein IJ22_18510 [Paenibacillus naphthalenovorans]
MIKLLLATVITILGSIAILTFVKPSKKELEAEAFENFEKAKKELFDAIVKTFKLDIFVEWLSEKLK